MRFQSTPPVNHHCKYYPAFIDISIHAAREGGDPMLCGTCAGKKISIHAAREGGDRSQQQDRIALPISIHAAREGGDTSPNQGFHNLQRFQSTPPVKAATADSELRLKWLEFQSTPPVKAATRLRK